MKGDALRLIEDKLPILKESSQRETAPAGVCRWSLPWAKAHPRLFKPIDTLDLSGGLQKVQTELL